MTIEHATGLAPTRHVLPSGVTVLAKESRTTPAVTISAALQAGSLYDPADRLGTAHFLSRVIDRGTTGRTPETIAETLDLGGVSLGIGVTRHALTLACTCLTEDFERMFALVADIIRNPTCPDEEVATRRGAILTGLGEDHDNPAVRAIEGLMATLYPDGHPYGRLAKGTAESVERIDGGALLEFHTARVTPSTVSLVIVGDVSADSAIGAADRVLADWRTTPGPEPSLDTPATPEGRRRVVVPMMNKAQADVAYGFTTIRRADPTYYATWLMANILGQYGMGGRLGQSIRERQGMAYYAFCGFEASAVAGPLVVRAGVNGANVDRAVASIDEELTRMASDGVTRDELADSKRYLIGSIPRTLETNAGIAAFLQSVEQFGLGLDHDRRLPDAIDAVTKDEVDAAARRILAPERAAVVIAGPYQ